MRLLLDPRYLLIRQFEELADLFRGEALLEHYGERSPLSEFFTLLPELNLRFSRRIA